MSVLPKRRRKRSYLAAPARRDQLLDVAKQVFAHQGYQRSNIEDICRAARVARGTVYQYFDNKRGVLLALMEAIAARIRAVVASRPRIAELPAAAHAPTGVIVDFNKKRLAVMLDAIFADEATVRLIVREGRGQDRAVDAVIADIDELMLSTIESDVRAAQKMGLVRRGDARRVAEFFLGGMERILFDAIAEDRPIDRPALVEQLVDLQLFGILNR